MTDDLTINVRHDDAFDALANLPENSVHAVVTDPPYGLAFMGRDWDDFDPREYQAWCEDWASTARRALKPGGHLLAFSGSRTHHRLFTGVEDAGFTIRDTITWHYGSGFPKGQDIGKGIDKAAGVEPDSVESADDHGLWADDSDWNPVHNREHYDSPTTDAAERWDGWNTNLKPATEFVVVARAPLAEDTIVENVLEHGTGALNIDGCRVDTDGESLSYGSREIGNGTIYSPQPEPDNDGEQHTEGRYPANVALDPQAAARLDAQAESDDGDSGAPSRYFYCPKAQKAERTHNGRVENDHPTVKPVALVEWLVRLVTAEGQTVLDPFAGSGTTGLAAYNTGRHAELIEQDADHVDLIEERLADRRENRSDDDLGSFPEHSVNDPMAW